MKRPKNPIIEFSDDERFELTGGSFDEFNKYIDYLEQQNKELIEALKDEEARTAILSNGYVNLENENKDLSEKNERLKSNNSERQLQIEILRDKLKNQ